MEPQTSADQMNHTAVETRSMRPVGGWRGERDRLNQMPAPDTPLPRGSIAFPLRLTALVCGSFLISSTATAQSPRVGQRGLTILDVENLPAPPVSSDLTDDGLVNVFDMLELLANWGG